VVPTLALFDDAALSLIFSKQAVHRTAEAAEAYARQCPVNSAAGVLTYVCSTLFQSLRWLVYLGLGLTIVVRSADPIKELFTASPWLHFYDDYFLINSQVSTPDLTWAPNCY
jgi:hypothetical protein